MKYIRQTFERLSRGGFISSDSTDEETKRIFMDLEDHLPDYQDYFAQIGFLLEPGKGFFYFSRKENRTLLSAKLERFGHWIDVLDFLKAWEPAFGPGFTFTKAELVIKMHTDIELKDKAQRLFEKKEKHEDIADKLIDDMVKQGYLEVVDETAQRLMVVSAYNYLESIVEMITIETEEEHEISE